MSDPTPYSLSGVEVHLWRNEASSSSFGMEPILESIFLGGKSGHAAVKVTFPCTSENQLLIERYCKNTSIPWRIIEDPRSKEKQAYEVYFSWSVDGSKLALNTAQDDQLANWHATNYQYEPEWRQRLNPVQQRYEGPLGETVVTHAPKRIMHLRAESNQAFELYIKFGETYTKLTSELEALELLLSKLDQQIGKPNNPISTTLHLLIERFAPDEKINPGMSAEALIRLKNKLESLKKELIEQKNNLSEGLSSFEYIYPDLNIKFQANADNLHEGSRPNDIIYLPLEYQSQAQVGLSKGLALEPMLAAMHNLVSNKTYDIIDSNCCMAADTILKSGAAHLKAGAVFEQKAWGGFFTPEVILHHAMGLQNKIHGVNKPSPFSRLFNFNPLEKLGAILMRNFFSSNKPTYIRNLSMASLIALAPIYVVTTFVKKLINPRQSLLDAEKFIRFAEKTKTKSFIVTTKITLYPIMAGLWLPSRVQTGILKIGSLFAPKKAYVGRENVQPNSGISSPPTMPLRPSLNSQPTAGNKPPPIDRSTKPQLDAQAADKRASPLLHTEVTSADAILPAKNNEDTNFLKEVIGGRWFNANKQWQGFAAPGLNDEQSALQYAKDVAEKCAQETKVHINVEVINFKNKYFVVIKDDQQLQQAKSHYSPKNSPKL